MEIIRKRSGRGLGLRFGFLLGLGFRLGFGLVLSLFFFRFLVGRLSRLVLEIRGVPAAALQLEACGAQQLAERRLMTNRAFGKWRLTDALQKLFLMPAGIATVFLDRHGARNPLGSDYIADFGAKKRASSLEPDRQRDSEAKVRRVRRHAEP